jgi:hypothetical protein
MKNIDKLKPNMKFKNYKELCEFLEEKPKTSCSKTKQINNWKKYFDFKKNKNSYKITEVYSTPKALTYTEKIELLLLNLMANNTRHNYMLFAPRTMLLESLNVVNYNYRMGNQHKEILADETQIDLPTIQDFFNSLNKALKYQLEIVLKNLASKNIISYNTVDMVCIEYINEFTKEKNKLHRQATEDEVEYYLEIKDEVMFELECDSIPQVIKQGKYPKFIEQVNDIIHFEKQYLFFYKSYKIVFNSNIAQNKLQKAIANFKLSPEYYRVLLEETNTEYINKTINNAENRQQKAITERKNITYKTHHIDDEVMDEFSLDELAILFQKNKHSIEYMLLRSDEDYVEKMEKLSNIILSQKAKRIIFLTEEEKENHSM